MTSTRFRATTIDAIDDIPVVGGSLRWKPVRRTLGIRAFGTNAYVADAGQEVVEPHDELSASGTGGHEELYVVLTGHATFTIDGEPLDAPAGTLVFLPDPAARREAIALQDGTTVLAVGGEPGRPYAVSAWEHYFAAERHVADEDWDAAAATVAAALPEHDGNPAVHYKLSDFLARAGRQDEARVHRDRARAADPERVAAWEAEDATDA
ncbi:MAG TPA: hypothetical protein VI318_23695 [Baekduia sp.]